MYKLATESTPLPQGNSRSDGKLTYLTQTWRFQWNKNDVEGL